MRLIHRVPFTSREVESYRLLVFTNITLGLKTLIDAMPDMGLDVAPENAALVDLISHAEDLRDGEPFLANVSWQYVLWRSPQPALRMLSTRTRTGTSSRRSSGHASTDCVSTSISTRRREARMDGITPAGSAR